LRNRETIREITIRINAAGSKRAKEGIPSVANSNTPYPNTLPDLKNKCDVAIRDIKKGEEITTNATKDDAS
tara:strand:- start:767 stop:979 length:213 start_codon:yes stop_codon:yes gene_type:complete